MRLTRTAAICATMLIFATRMEAAVITNGSFEDPVVPVASYTNFTTGSTAITGWTVVGVDVSVVNTNFNIVGITFQAQAGNQWLDLSGETSNSPTNGVTQNVATSIGQAYQLSFYVGSASDGGGSIYPATVDLSIDGGSRTTYFNPAAPTSSLDWLLFTVPFTATSTTTNITFYDGSASNNFLSGLDNVSITSVPEPASLTLLGIGASMVIGVVRRRRLVVD